MDNEKRIKVEIPENLMRELPRGMFLLFRSVFYEVSCAIDSYGRNCIFDCTQDNIEKLIYYNERYGANPDLANILFRAQNLFARRLEIEEDEKQEGMWFKTEEDHKAWVDGLLEGQKAIDDLKDKAKSLGCLKKLSLGYFFSPSWIFSEPAPSLPYDCDECEDPKKETSLKDLNKNAEYCAQCKGPTKWLPLMGTTSTRYCPKCEK